MSVRTPARRVLTERGVTVRQIASDTGLSYGVLAKIINGWYPRPPSRYVEALTGYLGVEAKMLFPREPDGSP